MDGEIQPEGGMAEVTRPRPVLIAVPFYQNEALVARLSQGLASCADDIAAIGAEVVFYNDSPHYAPLGQALAAILPTLQPAFACRIVENDGNIGFVRAMNRAVAEAVARGMDLLLLNSDTVVAPGALLEMRDVALLDTMHGFVNPRSDNATIATLPLAARLGARRDEAARAVYREFAARLPRLSYIPTAIGFCLLVKWEIIAELGGFDEIYGKGYNEENDLVMRASRLGYRAVMANHAFVAHEGEASFSGAAIGRDVWERKNRAILDARYPEYARHTQAYYDSPEVTAERLLAATVPDEHGMLDVALDCSSFVAAHNGTFAAGRQVLAAAAHGWADRFRLYVLCSEEVFAFHGFAALGALRADPHEARCFAAIFRIGQPYDWNSVQRLCLTGAALGAYMLDTISLDCPPLASNGLRNLWQFTMDHFDFLVTQSRQTDRQLRLRLRVPRAMASVVSPHSLDLAEYEQACALPAASATTLMVIGNHYHHKFVAPTANALARAFPDRRVVAFGLAPPSEVPPEETARFYTLEHLPNLHGSGSGLLDEAAMHALYADAAAIVFPSHAEGFGFPTLQALAQRRPIFARRLPATQEIWRRLHCDPNIHFYDTTEELLRRLATIPPWQDRPALPPGDGAARAAAEIRQTLERALQAASYTRIVARVQAMQFASDDGKTGYVDRGDPPEQAARLVARRIERLLHRAFQHKAVFRGARLAVRAARRLKAAFRHASPRK